MRPTSRIVLASTNEHKLREVREIFAAYPEIEIIPAHELTRNAGKLGAVENFDTYSANAEAKARLVNRATHYPSLADDTGLEVDALDGRPGVRSHRFAPPRPGMSQDKANIDLLLAELAKRPDSSRTARFVCTVALTMEGLTITATGTLNGTILTAPRTTGWMTLWPSPLPTIATRPASRTSVPRLRRKNRSPPRKA